MCVCVCVCVCVYVCVWQENDDQLPLIVGCSMGGLAALLGGAALWMWRRSRSGGAFRRHVDSPVHPFNPNDP